MKRQLSFLVLATCLVAAADGATNFLYDAYVTPSTLPTAITPAWVTDGPGKGGDSQTASGRLLTVVDSSASSAPSYYYYHNLGVSDISSSDEWEMRARVRVPSSGDLSSEGRAPFYIRLIDGSKMIGVGVAKAGNGTNRIFFIDSTAKPLDTGGGPRYDDVTLGNDDFFNIRVVREGTTPDISSTIRLYVDGVQVESEAYPTFPTISARDVLWGAISSPGYGTFELTGASFGIGGQNSAPMLLPEPSSTALCVLGALLGAWVVRRR